MKRTSGLAFVVIICVLAGSLASPAQERAGSAKRESIFDRVVYLEKEFQTELPQVGRYCDELELEKRRINIGDCELYVEQEGKGIPLVLVNGGPGGTHHCFHPWFSRAKDSARVIYYDQRGCGLSDYEPGKDGYSVDQAAGDLEALRKSLAIDKWVVLGYSYGGFLAQYYATKYPESLAGLILLGASPGMWVQMMPTRQYDFLSKEERVRIREAHAQAAKLGKERGWDAQKTMALAVYNAHLNGDWKRQHFYRPSAQKLAQGALYEWHHDLVQNFRNGIGSSMDRIDLTGAFEKCPIPTLILEGKWDLTWNTDKPGIIAKNHPGAKLVLFENAGHGIYDEETDLFFATLKDFLVRLPGIKAPDIAAYRAYLTEWDHKRRSSALFIVRTAGSGSESLTRVAQAYQRAWLDEPRSWDFWLKVGQAHYEVKNYAEALYVFEKAAQYAENKQNLEYKALALVWQGQMLDLLGRRDEAVKRYQEVSDLNINEVWEFSQYGLRIELSAYAKERMTKPFVRIENMRND
jgi:proline iminopeptidase